MKKVLITASVASMIDLFNMTNIKILKNEGYQVEVACNFEHGSITSQEKVDEFKQELINDGIEVYQLPIPRSIFAISEIITSYKMMKRICNDREYDMLHCHSPIGGLVARLACRKARKKGTKVIYTAHGFHFFKGAPKKNWLIYYPVERFLARYTDVLITINKEDYQTAQKFKVQRVEYIPGVGIDTDKFKNLKMNKIKKRELLGLSEDDFVIISVGELNKNKNHQIIIKAIAELRNKKVKYILCGHGFLERDLEQLSKDLGIPDQVSFLGFRNDIADLMSISDLFVFPSFREGLPVSLMEAMANKLPVVCSEIRGNSDLIEHKKGGYLVTPTDSERFADRIGKLVEDEELRKSFGDFNSRKIKNFSIENVTDKLVELYIS